MPLSSLVVEMDRLVCTIVSRVEMYLILDRSA